VAFQPSKKRNREEEAGELNVTPIMNLMVVLIPLLLSVAGLTELSLLEYLPPAEAGVPKDVDAPPSEPGPDEAKLDLLLNLSETSLQVSVFLSSDLGPNFYEIPLVNGLYNWVTLKDSLWSIKVNKVGPPIGKETVVDERTGEEKEIPKYRYQDGEEISIAAMGHTPFQTIIHAMDACKYYKIGGEKKTLFPITVLKQFQ